MNKTTIAIVAATIGALLLLPYVAQTSIVPVMILVIGAVLLFVVYKIKSYVSGNNESKGVEDKNVQRNEVDQLVNKCNELIGEYNEMEKALKKLKKKSGNKSRIKSLEIRMAENDEIISYYKSKLGDNIE